VKNRLTNFFLPLVLVRQIPIYFRCEGSRAGNAITHTMGDQDMQVFEFVIAIVAIVMAAGIINRWIQARQQSKEREDEPSLEDRLAELGVTAQLQKVDDLEARVRTLEKIATSKRGKLADEIDNL
jgi:mannose/fructose/N-acetylgalactosamine-specific phosphotransferase system component IID